MTEIEAIIERGLERLLPAPASPPDWPDVERRAVSFRSKRPLPRVALGALGLAGTLLAVLVLVLSRSGSPSIVDRAYAALSGRSGIMHFVVTYPGSGVKRYYEEYWIDLAHPSRERIVQSQNGKVDHQLVYVGGYRKVFGLSGRNHNPITIVTHAPPLGPYMTGADPNVQGLNPILGYRLMLRSVAANAAGSVRVLSQAAISYQGRPAYKLVIQSNEGPPNLVYSSARITYIVDRRSYYPFEWAAVYRAYGEFPGRVVTRYLRFEILPASPKSEALLSAAAKPQPYEP